MQDRNGQSSAAPSRITDRRRAGIMLWFLAGAMVIGQAEAVRGATPENAAEKKKTDQPDEAPLVWQR